jgi:hypothetical protein
MTFPWHGAPNGCTRPRTPWQRLKWLLVGSLMSLGALTLLLRGPLSGLLTPRPVPGLDAQDSMRMAGSWAISPTQKPPPGIWSAWRPA